MGHLGENNQISGNSTFYFISYFFCDKIIRGINCQLYKFKRRGIPLGFHNSGEHNRLSFRSKQNKNISLFNTAQVTNIDVVSTKMFSGLILKGDNLTTDNPTITKKTFEQIFSF